ncbi:unnamed protein product [Schistocephalus solidus]|uniref:Uncharacterized protein n=1 Tax=Schistocephalus solidus TaxID=70667 RepID=A0A3P7CM16_SCHSO|nr:unnamed protein product [Schistocephalus solidus]
MSPRGAFDVPDTIRQSGDSVPEQDRGMELDRSIAAATRSTAAATTTSTATVTPFQCPNFVSQPPPPVPLMYPALPLSATQTGRYDWPPIPSAASATTTITSTGPVSGTESVAEPPPSTFSVTGTATTSALQNNALVPTQTSIPVAFAELRGKVCLASVSNAASATVAIFLQLVATISLG